MDRAFEYLASIAGDEQEKDYGYKAEVGIVTIHISMINNSVLLY